MDVEQVVALAELRRKCRTGEARRIRIEAGVSQSEAGAPAGVGPAVVSRWENGERAPRGEAALRYAELLDDLAALACQRGGAA